MSEVRILEPEIDYEKEFKEFRERVLNYASKAVDVGVEQAYRELFFPEEMWITIPGPEKRVLNENILEFLIRNHRSIIEDVRTTIRDGIMAGKKRMEIAEDLRKRFALTAWKSELIARTETARAINWGKLETFYREGQQQVKWVAAGDSRTCSECADLDGRIFDIENVPPLPLHPLCRCTVIPYGFTRNQESKISEYLGFSADPSREYGEFFNLRGERVLEKTPVGSYGLEFPWERLATFPSNRSLVSIHSHPPLGTPDGDHITIAPPSPLDYQAALNLYTQGKTRYSLVVSQDAVFRLDFFPDSTIMSDSEVEHWKEVFNSEFTLREKIVGAKEAYLETLLSIGRQISNLHRVKVTVYKRK